MPEVIETKAPAVGFDEPVNGAADDMETDVWMPPDTQGQNETDENEIALIDRERRLWANEPVAEFVLPSGKKLCVYGKSEGQMRHVNIALQRWWDAESRADRQVSKRRWFRFWRKYCISKSLLEAQIEKCNLFRAIFSDPYNEPQNQELSEKEFLSLPESMLAAIYAAFKRANDGTLLVRAVLGDKAFENKKKDLNRVIQPGYTPSS